MSILYMSSGCDLRMSTEEFARWCEERDLLGDLNHYELLNGRVVAEPPAGYPHGEVESYITLALAGHVIPRGIGRVFGSSQGFVFPTGDTVEPDHSYVSQERWKKAPAPELGKFLRMVPDLLVEILAPKTARRDRGEKKAIYQRNGVREYWLVAPLKRSVTVFNMEGGNPEQGAVYTETDRFISRVLPGLEIQVGKLFPVS